MDEQPHRRTTRTLLRIPIEVSGTTPTGQAFQEETFTITVDGHGAQIVLKNPAKPGDRLTVTNLWSGKSCAFRIVRRVGNSPSKAAEWGIRCLQPETNFWGIYFPTSATPSFPAETEIIEGLLECRQCGSQEFAQLTLEQYKTLGQQPFLERECVHCGVPTKWGYSYVDSKNEFSGKALPASRPAPSTGRIEKRQARRLLIKLPVRIRRDKGREEIAGTENVSKMGVCFVSEARMNIGDIVRLVFGTTGLAGRTEIPVRVVRRQELQGRTESSTECAWKSAREIKSQTGGARQGFGVRHPNFVVPPSIVALCLPRIGRLAQSNALRLDRCTLMQPSQGFTLRQPAALLTLLWNPGCTPMTATCCKPRSPKGWRS